MVGLISARHTFHTFVIRYRDNNGARIEYDLTLDLPPTIVEVEEPAAAAAPSFERDPRMERLDPNEWKKQDHYMVLGLEHKRGEVCSPEDIRNAYRARVLVYHPDKIAQRLGEGKGKRQKDDAIFKCIQKAHETLNDPDRKAAFDSVDPTFDESIPAEKLPAGACFYATYGPVFERNMRFSRVKSSLVLGHADSPREQVEAFYQFWFDFDSVRRFDYLDEDDCETLDNRADKRWQDKKNKAARAKRKTEDNTRIRRLAEQAYKLDPRIKEYKEADKQAKLNRKSGRPAANVSAAGGQSEAQRKKAEAEAAAAVAAAQAAEEAAAREEAKRVKEAEASALRKERKALKTLFSDNNYFLPPGLDANSRLKMLEEEAMLLEQACQRLSRLQLGELRERISLEAASRAATNILREAIGVDQIERCASPVAEVKKPVEKKVETAAVVEEEWSLHDVDLLINGTKKFPGGTRNRWETIAEWFNRQASVQRTADDLIRKANDFKATGPAGMVCTPLESEPVVVSSKRDPRIDMNEPTLAMNLADASTAWTAEEQSALEAAMRSVAPSHPERWDAIAELVPSRTKKECMLRAKELATLLKANKK